MTLLCKIIRLNQPKAWALAEDSHLQDTFSTSHEKQNKLRTMYWSANRAHGQASHSRPTKLEATRHEATMQRLTFHFGICQALFGHMLPTPA